MAQAQPFDATPQRPTFTSDTSTTAPGTIELQSGATFASGAFSLPTTIKFTPGVSRGFFNRGEFSASFDSVTAVSQNGSTRTRFGERIDIAWRRPVYAKGNLSFAIVPQVTALLRDADGMRAGATGIVAYVQGRGALVVNGTFSKATDASASNPATAGSVYSDYLFTFGQRGRWSKVTVFAGILDETGTDQPNRVSLGQGFLWRVRPNLVLDAAIREVNINQGSSDTQALVGLTLNLGRVAR